MTSSTSPGPCDAAPVRVHPQCDGSGKLVIYRRGRMYPESKTCPQCAAGLGSVTHDESIYC